MAIDERLADRARSAAEHITDRRRELDDARRAFRGAVRALHLDGATPREIAAELGIAPERVQQLLDLPLPPDHGGPVRSNELTCTFCRSPRSAVGKLIAGPGGVAICNDCVALATDVVRDGGPAGTPARPSPRPARAAHARSAARTRS